MTSPHQVVAPHARSEPRNLTMHSRTLALVPSDPSNTPLAQPHRNMTSQYTPAHHGPGSFSSPSTPTPKNTFASDGGPRGWSWSPWAPHRSPSSWVPRSEPQRSACSSARRGFWWSHFGGSQSHALEEGHWHEWQNKLDKFGQRQLDKCVVRIPDDIISYDCWIEARPGKAIGWG